MQNFGVTTKSIMACHTFDRPFLLQEAAMFKWYGVCMEHLFPGGGAEGPV